MTTTNHGLIGDLRLQKALAMQMLLYIKDSTSLANTQWVTYYGSINGSGSATKSVPKVALDGYDDWDEFAGATEADPVSATALTSTSADIEVRRKALRMDQSDLMNITAPNGQVNTNRIVVSIGRSWERLFAIMTCTAIAGFTNVEGDPLATLSVDDWRACIQSLEGADGDPLVEGPYVAKIHPKQWADLQNSLANETSTAIAYSPATPEQIEAKGSNYKGSVLGVETYTSSHITDDATSYLGAMWGPQALGYADAQPDIPNVNIVIKAGKVTIEVGRTMENGVTKVVGHSYLGISITDDDRGRSLQSLM